MVLNYSTVTPTLRSLQDASSGFLKISFVLKFTPKHLLLKLSELNSVESEIALKEFLFFLLKPKLHLLSVSCLILGLKAFLIPALIRWGYFDQWFTDSSFPTYFTWETIVYRKIREFEANAWATHITDHPDLYIAQACLENTSPCKFWSISEQFPDLVCSLHTQVRLMGSIGLNGRILWLRNTEGTLCFICKQENETQSHFLFVCTSFRPHFVSLWANLVNKIDSNHINQISINITKRFCY